MINLAPDVLNSSLWVVPADVEDQWYSYFDWLSQFELTKMKHISWCEEKGYSLFIDPRGLLSHHLLIVRVDRLMPAQFSEVWQSLGKPNTTFFSSKKSLGLYSQLSDSFCFVTDIE